MVVGGMIGVCMISSHANPFTLVSTLHHLLPQFLGEVATQQGVPSLSLENQRAFIFLPHASSVWAVCLQHGPNDPPSAPVQIQLYTVWPLLQTW